MIRNWILKTTDFLAGPLVCSLIARFISLRGKSKAPEHWNPNSVKRILIVRPGGIGDMILLLPTLTIISKRFPTAAVDVICERRNMAVLSLSNSKARCLPFDSRPASLLNTLLRTKYDIAIDSEQFHHFSAVFTAISGAVVRVGFNINPRRNGLYTHLIPYSPDSFEGREFLRLLAPLGVKNAKFVAPSLRPADPITAVGADLDDRISALRKGRKLLVLHAGGSTRRKLWPERKMSELILELLGDNKVAILLLGSTTDRTRTAEILSIADAGTPVMALTESLSLEQCAAVISMADLFVGPDSGLLHMAAACGTASVALFGPSDHRKWGYEDHNHVVVRNDIPCAPCFIFGYSKPCGNYQCIDGIEVADVAAACRSLTGTQG